MAHGHVGVVPGSSRRTGDADPLDVAIVDGSGNQITSFGSGTASTFGAAFPATGTAAGFIEEGTGQMEGAVVDALGNLKVNVAAGSAGNSAASATGAAVPTDAGYVGLNVGGTLRGQTGVNPSGVVYAAQVDLASIAGTVVATLDFDTGGGSQAMPIFGIALPASGGAVAGGTATNPLRIDPTGSTTQPVSATDLDIRDLVFASDKVDASGSALGANSGVDIGDVTINNAAGGAAVNIQDGGNTITVDGTVAVSSSALPTGAATLAEQQTQTTALSVLDDWDESDRAKVNPIAGQAGVQGGSGTVSDLTQRVVLATNVGLPAGTSLLGHVIGDAGASGGWSSATGSIAATKTDIGSANTAGQVGGWYFYNANATVSYVQFFNAQASAVTLGSTAPVYSLGIPALAAANIPPGVGGIAHATAISIAITTTRAGSTGPAATVDYNIWYKQ